MRRAVLGLALCAAGMAAADTPPEAVRFDGGAVAVSLTGAPGDPAAGFQVMTTAALGNCVACHALPDAPQVEFPGDVGPPLAGVASRHDAATLRGLVIDAKRMFPGTIMPGFYKTGPFVRPGAGFTGKAPAGALPPILTARQVEDVVAYLTTLR